MIFPGVSRIFQDFPLISWDFLGFSRICSGFFKDFKGIIKDLFAMHQIIGLQLGNAMDNGLI